MRFRNTPGLACLFAEALSTNQAGNPQSRRSTDGLFEQHLKVPETRERAAQLVSDHADRRNDRKPSA
jgi:hypothetical protein